MLQAVSCYGLSNFFKDIQTIQIVVTATFSLMMALPMLAVAVWEHHELHDLLTEAFPLTTVLLAYCFLLWAMYKKEPNFLIPYMVYKVCGK